MEKSLIDKLNGCSVWINTYYPESDEPESEELFDTGFEFRINDGKLSNPYDDFEIDLSTVVVDEEYLAETLCYRIIYLSYDRYNTWQDIQEANVQLYCTITDED